MSEHHTNVPKHQKGSAPACCAPQTLIPLLSVVMQFQCQNCFEHTQIAHAAPFDITLQLTTSAMVSSLKRSSSVYTYLSLLSCISSQAGTASCCPPMHALCSVGSKQRADCGQSYMLAAPLLTLPTHLNGSTAHFALWAAAPLTAHPMLFQAAQLLMSLRLCLRYRGEGFSYA